MNATYFDPPCCYCIDEFRERIGCGPAPRHAVYGQRGMTSGVTETTIELKEKERKP